MVVVAPLRWRGLAASDLRSPSARNGSSAAGKDATKPVTKREAAVLSATTASTSSGVKNIAIQRGLDASRTAARGMCGQAAKPKVKPA